MTGLSSTQQKIQDIGARIASIRLSRNLTQGQLAKTTGFSRSTIRRLEAGETSALETYIRVVEALGLEVDLDAMLPDPSVRPVDRVRLQGQERQRARPDEQKPKKASEWAWGEEVDE
jgi:transcriptional regulator with XRE-family HTH domain